MTPLEYTLAAAFAFRLPRIHDFGTHVDFILSEADPLDTEQKVPELVAAYSKLAESWPDFDLDADLKKSSPLGPLCGRVRLSKVPNKEQP